MEKPELKPSKENSKLMNDQIKWINFLDPKKDYPSKTQKILNYLLSKDKQLEPHDGDCKIIRDVLVKANEYFDSGDYEDAITLYDIALAINPINTVAFCNKATALLEQKACQKAKLCMNEAAFHERVRKYEDDLLENLIKRDCEKIKTLKTKEARQPFLGELIAAFYILGKRKDSFEGIYGDVENYHCLLRVPKEVQETLTEELKYHHLKHKAEQPKSVDDLAKKYEINYIR